MALMRALLGSLAALLVLSQYVTMAKFHTLSASLSYLSAGAWFGAIGDHVDLGWVDALLLGAIAGLAVAVAVLECRGAHLSRFLREVFQSEAQTIGLLLLSCLICVRYYLSPGDFNFAADSSQHIAYADIAAAALRDGVLPFHTWYLGTGSPFLQFYGFLFFWLTGLVAVLVPDTFVALKLVLAALHVLSGLGAYAAARAGGCTRGAAFVAGIGFVLCFWHAQHVLIMGRLQVSIVYALLPWPVWALEAALSKRHTRDALPAVLIGGVALGALVLSHPGFGYWGSAFVLLYGLVRWIAGGGPSVARLARVGGLVVLSLVVGGALAVPMWLERGATGLGSIPYTLAGTPDPTWWHVLVWSNFRFWLWPPTMAEYNWYGGYLGLSLIVLATIATVGSFRRWRGPRPAAAIATVACLLGGLVMVFGYRTFLVQWLPNAEILGSGRYLIFVSLFLALSAGHGVHGLQVWARTTGRTSRRLATLALLVVVADLGPTTFQHAYTDADGLTDPSGVAFDFYESIREHARVFESRGEIPPYRAVWVRAAMHRFMATGLLYTNTHTPVPDGPHPGELVAIFRYVRPFERLVNTAIADAVSQQTRQLHLDATLYAGMALLNVRYLLARSESGTTLGLELPDPSPIHVSSRLEPPPPASPEALSRMLRMDLTRLLASSDPREVAGMTRVLSWLEGMNVDPRARTARAFFIDGLTAPVDLGTEPAVEVIEHRVRTERVDLRVRLSQPAFARLAYGHYPYNTVLVDGEPVDTVPTADGFIGLELPAGLHDIAIESGLSGLRTAWLWLSLGVSVAALLMARRIATR